MVIVQATKSRNERTFFMANSLAHTKWVCKYHIVFAPKYRRKIIYSKIREDLQGIIKDLCKWKGVEIIEGHMMPDQPTAEIQRIAVYGIPERKKCDDDIRTSCKSEI